MRTPKNRCRFGGRASIDQDNGFGNKVTPSFIHSFINGRFAEPAVSGSVIFVARR